MLVVARLVTGAGEAAMFVGVATAAQDLAPDHRRGEAASYFSVALYGGLAVGPPIGEALGHGYVTLWVALAASLGPGRAGQHVDPAGPHGRRRPRRAASSSATPCGRASSSSSASSRSPRSSFVPLYAEDLGQSSVGAVFGLYAGLVLIVRIVGPG